jgi:hypothetical protein
MTYGVMLTLVTRSDTRSTFVPARYVHALAQAAPLTALPIDDGSVYATFVDGHVLPVIVLSKEGGEDNTGAMAMLVCSADGERFALTGFTRAEFCEHSEATGTASLDVVSLLENLKRSAWRTGVYASVAQKEKEPSYG